MAPPLKPLRDLTYVPLADVALDTTFRLRHPGDVSSLARSIAQVGQLFPVEVRETGNGLQALAGFRRLEALRMLQRNRVLVRNHGPLTDAAAAVVAAADAIDTRALDLEDLRELHERYVAMGWGTPALLELIGRSIEKEGERLEDLAAKLRGEAPPDRSVVDEDAADDAGDAQAASAAHRDGDAQAANAAHRDRDAQAASAAHFDGDASSASAAHRDGDASSANAAHRDGDAQAANAAHFDGDASSANAAHRDGNAQAANAAQPKQGAVSVDAAVAASEALQSVARPAQGGGPAESTRVLVPVVLAPLPLDPPSAPRLGVVEAQSTEHEMTADALARHLAERLSEATQDLSLLADHWNTVPSGLRAILADQLDYYGRLATWLGPRDGDET